MFSNKDTIIKKEPDYSESGYDFFEHDFQLPGEICIDIFEFTSQFEKEKNYKKWYDHEEIYDLSEGILNHIWLDPDNPNGVIYIEFQAYDHHREPRQRIEINVSEIKYSGIDVLDNSDKDSSNEYNNKFSNKYKIENWNIVKKENMIYDCPYTRTELDERFLYSRLYLGYDYEIIINKYGEKTFKLLPVKNKVLSLKNLSIRNIKLWIAEQLYLIKEINKAEIILKPLTLRGQHLMVGYRKWLPNIVEFHERLLQNQPQYIRDILQLYKF